MENIKAPLVIEAIKDAGWQRKITAQCDAISPSFPTSNISLAKDLFEGTVTEGKQYVCELEATGLKSSDKDPDKTWNYWWKITKWDVEEGDTFSPPMTVTYDTPPELYGKPSGKPVFDATAGQRYTQYCTNVRTAIMQSVEMLTENGVLVAQSPYEELFETADKVLEWLNGKAFSESPLVAHAIDLGAVPVERLEDALGDALEDAMELETKAMNRLASMGDDDISKDWTLPSAIANGKEFKEAALKNGFELDWVMKKFQQIGISKSADYVTGERGSYLDLLNKLMDMSKNEKSEESEEI